MTLEDMIRAAAAAPDRIELRATAPADVQAAAGEGKRPTFEIVGYTGAAVQLSNFFVPVIVELSGLRAASQQIPALREHDTGRIVGQTDRVAIGQDVRLAGTITGENDDAREVTTQAKNGFKWQASIGATIVRREFLEPGKRAVVNGRQVAGPLVIARESVLREISFVALGADGDTSAAVAASASHPNGTNPGDSPMNFDQWLTAKGFSDPAALTDAQRTSLKAMFDAEQAPPPAQAGNVQAQQAPAPPPAAQTFDQIIEARRAEDRRVEAINLITARWLNDRPAQVDAIERFGKAAIEARSTTADQYELMLLRELRAAAPPAVHARGDGRTAGRVIEAALCLSGGLSDPDKHFDARTLDAAADRFRHGIGLCELLQIAARENGHGAVSGRDVHGLLEAAFGRGREIRASGFSSISLPGILSNVANKFLATGFLAVEDAWRMIAFRRSVSDFKSITSYSLTGDLQYEEVGATGELKHGTLGELEYTNRARTYGRILSITRQDIINDDLGALTQVPMRLGRGAALKLNDVFWTAFLAGVGSFWASGNANLVSGAGTALSSAGLKAASDKFKKQTDPNGKPLGVTPRILLVPTELEITADELMTSVQVNTGGAATTEKVPNRNVWASKFKAVSSTYLSNSSYTGYSAAAWWLLADPMDMATIEVAFLNGREQPTVESADADFDTLGIKMRGYHDFGVALQEKRASVRAAGS